MKCYNHPLSWVDGCPGCIAEAADHAGAHIHVAEVLPNQETTRIVRRPEQADCSPEFRIFMAKFRDALDHRVRAPVSVLQLEAEKALKQWFEATHPPTDHA